MADLNNNPKNLKQLLKACDDAPAPPASGEFWHEFRKRADVRKEESIKESRRSFVLFRLAAAASVVLAGSLFFQDENKPPAKPVEKEAGVESVEVFEPNTSVMILEDADTGAKIVWVTGMEK